MSSTSTYCEGSTRGGSNYTSIASSVETDANGELRGHLVRSSPPAVSSVSKTKHLASSYPFHQKHEIPSNHSLAIGGKVLSRGLRNQSAPALPPLPELLSARSRDFVNALVHSPYYREHLQGESAQSYLQRTNAPYLITKHKSQVGVYRIAVRNPFLFGRCRPNRTQLEEIRVTDRGLELPGALDIKPCSTPLELHLSLLKAELQLLLTRQKSANSTAKKHLQALKPDLARYKRLTPSNSEAYRGHREVLARKIHNGVSKAKIALHEAEDREAFSQTMSQLMLQLLYESVPVDHRKAYYTLIEQANKNCGRILQKTVVRKEAVVSVERQWAIETLNQATNYLALSARPVECALQGPKQLDNHALLEHVYREYLERLETTQMIVTVSLPPGIEGDVQFFSADSAFRHQESVSKDLLAEARERARVAFELKRIIPHIERSFANLRYTYDHQAQSSKQAIEDGLYAIQSLLQRFRNLGPQSISEKLQIYSLIESSTEINSALAAEEDFVELLEREIEGYNAIVSELVSPAAKQQVAHSASMFVIECHSFVEELKRSLEDLHSNRNLILQDPNIMPVRELLQSARATFEDVGATLAELDHRLNNARTPAAVDFVIEELSSIFDKLHPLVQNFLQLQSEHKNFKEVEQPIEVLNDLEQGIQELSKSAILVQELLLSKHWHGEITEFRAGELLKRKISDAYLVAASVTGEYGYFLFLKAEGRISKIPLLVSEGELLHNGERFALLADMIRSLSPKAQSVSARASSFYAAQLEWNSCSKPVDEVLADVPNGSACLNWNKDTKTYELWVRKDDNPVLHYHLSAEEDGIRVQGLGRNETLRHLHELCSDENWPLTHFLTGKSDTTLAEELYYRRVLPLLKEPGRWRKLSRQQYPFLPRSLFVSGEGLMYEQYHGRQNPRAIGWKTPIEGKHLLGRGRFKDIWGLKTHAASTSSADMVRGRFGSKWKIQEDHIARMNRLRSDLQGSQYHLIAQMFMYQRGISIHRTQPEYAVSVVMPLAPGGSLENAFMKLTRLGTLRLARDLLYGLRDIEKAGWIYRDMKLANVLLRSTDPEDPQAAYSDHDMCFKPKGTSPASYQGNLLHVYPKYRRKQCSTFEDFQEAHLYSWASVITRILLKQGKVDAPRFGRRDADFDYGLRVTPSMVAKEKPFSGRDFSGWEDKDSLERVLWDCLLQEMNSHPFVQSVSLESVIARVEDLVDAAELSDS